MGKTNLTVKRKTAGTYIRLTPEFKKRAQIYAIENNISLTDLIVDSVSEKIGK